VKLSEPKFNSVVQPHDVDRRDDPWIKSEDGHDGCRFSTFVAFTTIAARLTQIQIYDNTILLKIRSVESAIRLA
jgi:hypothetical protein